MVPADAEDAISSSPIVVAITNLNADIRNIFLTPLKQLRRRSVKVKSFFIRSRNWCEIQDKTLRGSPDPSEVFDLKPTSPPARSSYDGAIIGNTNTVNRKPTIMSMPPLACSLRNTGETPHFERSGRMTGSIPSWVLSRALDVTDSQS